MATWKEGDPVTTRGRISTVMWQHLMTGVDGKKHGYFDVEGESHQIVVYWKAAPQCAALIEVTGKVLVVRGQPKRPGQKETKVDDSYSELYIDVDSARCVE